MTTRATSIIIAVLCALMFAGAARAAEPPAPATRPQRTVRVAAIGGINDHGFWQAVADRFEERSGIHVRTVAAGNKDAAGDLFKRGGVDLITLQSSEAIIALVADGYARDPEPWLATDLIIVGPAADPAGIKGAPDAAAAIRKILAAQSPFVVHASLGADQVVRSIVQADRGRTVDGQATVLLDDHQKRVLQVAADKQAYTLIAAAPFREGKIPAGGLVELLRGDPILRRPITLATADPRKAPDARCFEAARLAEFLRSDDTQQWIDAWRPADAPAAPQAFFPVNGDVASKLAPGVILRITGAIDHRVDLTPDAFAKLPRATVKVPGTDGGPDIAYAGARVRDVLRAAGVPLGNHQLRGTWTSRTLRARAADGYAAAFAVAEFDDDLGERSVLIADRKDGQPLVAGEGPLRLIVPGEQRPMRSAKQVTVLEVR